MPAALHPLSDLFPDRRTRLVLAVLTISAVVGFSYARILTLGFTGWDTLTLIEWSHRSLSRSAALLFARTLMPGLPYYRPLSNLSYGLDFMLWGTGSWGYHLEDILFHWLTCLGVMVLGIRAAGRVAVGWLAGLLLALHPAFAIIVANISYRQDVLVTLALVWGLFFTISFPGASGRRRFFFRVLAYLAFVSALGFKEVGIIALPLTLALLAYQYRGAVRRAFLEASPFLGITAGYIFLHLNFTPPNLVPPLNPGAWNFRLPLAYLQALVVPGPDLSRFAGILAFVFYLAFAFLLARTARRPSSLFWILFWLGWILLAVGVYLATNFQDFVERYAYVVAPPLFLLIAMALFARFPAQAPLLRRSGYVARLALVGILLLWLPTTPLLGLPRVWWEREITTDAYLMEFDRIVAELPPTATLELENVPPKWVYLDSLKSWLALKWRDKQIRIARQTPARKPGGKPVLSLKTPAGSHRVIIHATYHLTED